MACTLTHANDAEKNSRIKTGTKSIAPTTAPNGGSCMRIKSVNTAEKNSEGRETQENTALRNVRKPHVDDVVGADRVDPLAEEGDGPRPRSDHP